jgi:hypothetical protein
MSVTYGYDLKKNDKMLEAPEQASEYLKPVLQPGASLVNHLPFCAASGGFMVVMSAVPNCTFQCALFLHGYHTSAMNHWRDQLGN